MATYTPEINTTPLIDVLLVLLVVLILSPPVATHLVGMNVPGRGTAAPTAETVDVDIDFDGQVYWNGRRATNIRTLERWFQDISQKQSETLVRVYPDRGAHFERVAEVLAAAQRARVQRLWLAPTTQGSFQD